MKKMLTILFVLVAALALAAPASATPNVSNGLCDQNPHVSWCTGASEVDCPPGFEYTGDPDYPCHDSASGPDAHDASASAHAASLCPAEWGEERAKVYYVLDNTLSDTDVTFHISWPDFGGTVYVDKLVPAGKSVTLHETVFGDTIWVIISANDEVLFSGDAPVTGDECRSARGYTDGDDHGAEVEHLDNVAYDEGNSGQDALRGSLSDADPAPVVPVATAATLPDTGAEPVALAVLALALLAAGGATLARVRS